MQERILSEEQKEQCRKNLTQAVKNLDRSDPYRRNQSQNEPGYS